jgi:hypothetical protein
MPFAVAGAGVAIGLTGALFQNMANSNYRDYDAKVASCNTMTGGNGGCQQSASLADLRSSGDTKRTTGIILYGAGAATIAAGALLYVLNRPQAYSIRAEDLNNEKLTVAPVVTPTYAGAAVEGRF